MAVNHLVFQGRNVRDLELRTTNSGIECVNFTLAWSEKYKEVEKTCFQECKAWRGTAVFIDKYFHNKGSEMIVEGKLETEKWEDKDGNKRSKNVLTVDAVHFCGKRQDGNAPSGDASGGNATGGNGGFMPAPDDELPF